MKLRHQIKRFVIPVLTATAVLLSACAPAMAPAAHAPAGDAPGSADYALEAPAAAYAEETSRPRQGPPDMFFQDYGTNNFESVNEDNLSTFAVDVDTGAYTVARSYVKDGLLPPAAAVRVEEFVNYFDYGYALPAGDATFNILLDAAPSPFVQSPRTRLLRVGIQGYEIPADMRQDVALTFVVDISGSMERENRLGLVKQALHMLVNELRPSDSVALVVYGSTARLVLPMTPVAERAVIQRGIDQLMPGGSTNAEEGLTLGYRHAWQNFNPQAVNRVILASDGVANVGRTGPQAILEAIEEYAARGITMTSIGVGMGNYNDVLMEQLADSGDGFYAYVDTLDEAHKLFVEDLTASLLTIAMDAKVQVEFNPAAVARYRLIGYENRDVADDDFRNDAVDAGEIGAGHSVTALYEVELAPRTEPDATLATVRLRWQDVGHGEVVEMARSLTVAEVGDDYAAAPVSLQLAAVVAEYAEMLRHSEWATASPAELLAAATQVNVQINAEASGDGDVSELVDLIWAAGKLSEPRALP